jgi:urea transport system substrate-binding protein
VVFAQQLSVAEPEIASRVLHLQHLEDFHRAIDPAAMAGDLVACSFVADETSDLVKRFKARYGANRTVTDSMALAYTAVLLWAKAVQEAGSENVDSVLAALPSVEVESPFGTLKADAGGRHFRFPLLVAEFTSDGSMKVVHRTGPLAPGVYPPSRPAADWDRFLRQLYFRWGERWCGPQSS